MRTKPIAALCAASAIAAMALGVTTATARNFSVNNQQFRGTFNNFTLFQSSFVTDTCRVTLEGSFHTRTMPKVAGSLIGYITRTILGQCRVGTTLLTATLPWHISYESFSGRLPDITLIVLRATNFSFRIEICLVRADFRFRISRDPITRHIYLLEVPRQSVPIIEGILCPEEGTLESVGRGQIYLLNSTTRISLTLI